MLHLDGRCGVILQVGLSALLKLMLKIEAKHDRQILGSYTNLFLPFLPIGPIGQSGAGGLLWLFKALRYSAAPKHDLMPKSGCLDYKAHSYI